MTKPTYKLDILQKEKDEDLPYWLDPSQRYDPNSERSKAIREKYRSAWLAKQEAKKEKAWDESAHPRVPAGSSEGGEFGEGGGGGGEGEGADHQSGGGELTKLDRKRVSNWCGDGYRAMRYDKTFAKTLNKLPLATGKLYRGARLTDEALGKLKAGSIFSVEKFSSATTRREVAYGFMDAQREESTKHNPVVFDIQGSGRKIPRDIAKEQGVEDEAEAVMMIGDKYRIDKVTVEKDDNGNPYTRVQMSQVHGK